MATLLFPILFIFFLLPFEELVFLLLLFLRLLSRFYFQWSCTNDSQIGATFVATDGVPFVDVFFINIDGAFAYRTRDHCSLLRKYLM